MLRFISWVSTYQKCHSNISIHPMLRFIFQNAHKSRRDLLFQYIPCYGLSIWRWNIYLQGWISIHPMLRFINKPLEKWNYTKWISIHPMLRFILDTEMAQQEKSIFQYIPCYGLSNQERRCLSAGSISIHPMLRFIAQKYSWYSRYSPISIHPMLRFI